MCLGRDPLEILLLSLLVLLLRSASNDPAMHRAFTKPAGGDGVDGNYGKIISPPLPGKPPNTFHFTIMQRQSAYAPA